MAQEKDMTAFATAMMEGLSKMLGCDCPGEAPGDYRDEEGLLVCGVCGQRKEVRRDVPYLGIRVHPRNCECEERRLREKEEADRIAKENDAVKALFKFSLIDDRFKESRFENFIQNEHNARQLKIAKNYVERFDEMFRRNKGLLFYGEPSTGKTYLASCIANALLEKRVPIIVTSLIRLTSSASPFSQDEDKKRLLLSKMNAARVLFIDDLGTERDTPYKMEQVFEVIDSRYGAKKPMIVTTNLSLRQMQNEPNLRQRCVYERIFEVCHPVEFSDPSWRWKAAEDDYDEIEKLLLGE